VEEKYGVGKKRGKAVELDATAFFSSSFLLRSTSKDKQKRVKCTISKFFFLLYFFIFRSRANRCHRTFQILPRGGQRAARLFLTPRLPPRCRTRAPPCSRLFLSSPFSPSSASRMRPLRLRTLEARICMSLRTSSSCV